MSKTTPRVIEKLSSLMRSPAHLSKPERRRVTGGADTIANRAGLPHMPHPSNREKTSRRNLLQWPLIAISAIAVAACSMSEKPLDEKPPEGFSAQLHIAFGSCNKQHKDQSYWQNMADYFANGPGYPAAWVWLGDIVYADTEDLETMRAAYAAVLNGPYASFADQCRQADCQILGVWDDHDFGANNLRGYIPPGPLAEDSPFRKLSKPERKAALIEFLGEPTASQTADYEQVYASYDFIRDDLQVRLILLDVRYDRQRGGRKLLGADQWDWLKEQLMDERVDIQLLGSATQVLREDTTKDAWAKFPDERTRLLKLIADSPAQGTVILSGDIHAAEVSRLGPEQELSAGLEYPLYEVTASGLNNLRCRAGICLYNWRNAYQQGFAIAYNFGEIKIASDNEAITVWAALRSTQAPDSQALLNKVIHFPRRSPRT